VSLERQLLEGGAGWILKDFPAMADLIPGKFRWPRFSGPVTEPAGGRDAALARDTLSSQGLAAGISDAFVPCGRGSERLMLRPSYL